MSTNHRIVDDSPLLGQQSILNRLIEMPASFEGSEIKSYKTLEILDRTSLLILEAAGENPGLKSREIEEKLHMSRAPVLTRTKDMSNHGLLVRRVVPGTENRSKPAYQYFLPQNVSLQDIKTALSRFPVRPQTQITMDAETASPGNDEIAAAKQSFEHQIAVVINKMAQEIVALQNRVSDLEGKLSQESHRGEGVDFTDVINLLNSMQNGRAK